MIANTIHFSQKFLATDLNGTREASGYIHIHKQTQFSNNEKRECLKYKIPSNVHRNIKRRLYGS